MSQENESTTEDELASIIDGQHRLDELVNLIKDTQNWQRVEDNLSRLRQGFQRDNWPELEAEKVVFFLRARAARIMIREYLEENAKQRVETQSLLPPEA